MSLLNHALHAGRAEGRGPVAAGTSVIVVGGGGALGSAVLEHLLASRCFGAVRVLVRREVHVAMSGLDTVVADPMDGADDEGDTGGNLDDADDDPVTEPEPATATPTPTAIGRVAVVVFDRPRHANGRELAFTRPQPHALPALARWLQGRGVKHLLVVMPHRPAGLPQAMQAGLANLDEHAVSALGFEHLVFVRSAQAPSGARSARWLQRVADAMLSQFSIMIAATQQPVRARKVAQLIVALAQQLPQSPPGTRVASPELVWQAAQTGEPGALVAAWLSGQPLPARRPPGMRL